MQTFQCTENKTLQQNAVTFLLLTVCVYLQSADLPEFRIFLILIKLLTDKVKITFNAKLIEMSQITHYTK